MIKFLFKIFIFYFIFIIPNFAEKERPDFFTLHDISQLAKIDLEIVHEIKNLKKEIENKINFFKRFLNDYKHDLISIDKNINGVFVIRENELISDISKNPLKIFKLIWRNSQDLSNIEDLVKNNSSEKEFLSKIEGFKESFTFPNDQDLIKTISSIVNIHQFYRLNATELSDGIILNSDLGVGLTLVQIAEIGVNALERGFYATAIEFFETFNLKIQGKNYTEAENPIEIYLSEIVETRLQEAYEMHDVNWGPMEILDNHMKYYSQPILNNKNERRYIDIDKVPTLRNESDNLSQRISHLKLCRGEEIRPLKEVAKLKCFLHSKQHPFWILNPLKLEVLNESPPVLMVHEIYTEKEIEKIIKRVKPEMETAIVIKAGKRIKSEERVAANAYLKDHEGDEAEFRFIRDKIGKVTGLNVAKIESSEDVRITNYATGGHFVPHWDGLFHNEKLKKEYIAANFTNGDRILTFLTYLAEPELGGRTVFPSIGVQSEPLKGSGIFWYNLKKDTSVEILSKHAGCPLLLGIKWVSIKLITADEQMFIRKCPLEQKDLSYDLKSIGFGI